MITRALAVVVRRLGPISHGPAFARFHLRVVAVQVPRAASMDAVGFPGQLEGRIRATGSGGSFLKLSAFPLRKASRKASVSRNIAP